MSWLAKLSRSFTRGANTTERQVQFPVRIDVSDGPTVHVHLHDIDTPNGTISCWSYVTEGLAADKQREIVFTLQREATERPESYPMELFQLFAAIQQFAKAGRIVEAGDVTRFGARSPFGRHLVYIQHVPFKTVPAPDSALSAILVSEDEVIAAQEFGATRLAARLGYASRWFPCPPWSDRQRPGLPFTATRERSLLARMGCARMRGVSVFFEGDRVVVRAAPTARERLAQLVAELADDRPVALLTDIDANADGCYVWEPGQTQPVAITPPHSRGARISGCFVAFVPGQDTDTARLLEDGIAILIKDSTWTALRRSFRDSEPLRIPATGNYGSIELELFH